jgi:hypothetical protein
MLKGEVTVLCQSAANIEFSHLTGEIHRVSVNQFHRQRLSYNSRQNPRRDKNLLLKKIAEMIP